MEKEVRGRFKREGTYIYPRLIHVNVWEKPIQYYKAIILQLIIIIIIIIIIKTDHRGKRSSGGEPQITMVPSSLAGGNFMSRTD